MNRNRNNLPRVYVSIFNVAVLAIFLFEAPIVLGASIYDAPRKKSSQSKMEKLLVAAELGNTDAKKELAAIYYHGAGIPSNKRKALEMIYEAAAAGDKEAECDIAISYVEDDSRYIPGIDISFLVESAQDGCVAAETAIGFAHLKGRGVERDVLVGQQWLHRAAKKGDPRAMGLLGAVYYLGIGVPIDYEQALYWKELSMDNGGTRSINAVAYAYAYGLGTEKDPKKAIKLWKRESKLGNHLAEWSLGSFYLNSGDNDKGFFWLHRAAENGSSGANFQLGEIYLHGQYQMPVDLEMAEEYFEVAARRDYSAAYAWLGHMKLSVFKDERKDPEQGVAMLKYSAESGVMNGQYFYGMALKRGDGTPRDLVGASEWFRRSAIQGHALAAYEVSSMYLSGRGVEKDRELAYAWSLIALRLDPNLIKAEGIREESAAMTSAEQRAGAEKLAGEWEPTADKTLFLGFSDEQKWQMFIDELQPTEREDIDL